MKKKNYKKLVVLLMSVFVILASTSCKDNIDLSIYVSEYRSGIYEGEGSNLNLTVYLENREDPFIIDGFVGEMKKVLVIKLHSENRVINSASIKLNYDNYECCGDFEFSVLSGKYTAEIFVDELPKTPTVKATFSCGEETVEVELKSKAVSGNLSYKEILESVRKSDKELVDSLFNVTSVSTEIHIRLISDKYKNYYYVGLAEKTGKIHAYLVDAETGEVLAKKST